MRAVECSFVFLAFVSVAHAQITSLPQAHHLPGFLYHDVREFTSTANCCRGTRFSVRRLWRVRKSRRTVPRKSFRIGSMTHI